MSELVAIALCYGVPLAAVLLAGVAEASSRRRIESERRHRHSVATALVKEWQNRDLVRDALAELNREFTADMEVRRG